MKPLTTETELAEVRIAASKVFHSVELWPTKPFQKGMTSRRLIYPIDYTMLGPAQFAAVAEAALSVHDTSAYVVAYSDVRRDWGGTYDHRQIDLTYSDYKRDDELILEHVLFSPSGKWGVVTSHGDFAVAGGDDVFGSALRERLLADDDDAVASSFVRHWKEVERSGGDSSWVVPLLTHLHGAARASELWESAIGPPPSSET